MAREDEADVDGPRDERAPLLGVPRPVPPAGGVIPHEAGHDGEGQEPEAPEDAAPAQGVAPLEAGDEVVERPRGAALELAFLDEVQDAGREGHEEGGVPEE